MEFLILLILLQAKHCYADFYLQTYMQTIKKGEWLNLVGVSHSMEHAICTLVALLVFSTIVPLSALTIVTVAIAEGVLHYMIDYTKVKYGIKDNTKPLFWTQFGLDQLSHQLTYVAMIAYILL